MAITMATKVAHFLKIYCHTKFQDLCY